MRIPALVTFKDGRSFMRICDLPIKESDDYVDSYDNFDSEFATESYFFNELDDIWVIFEDDSSGNKLMERFKFNPFNREVYTTDRKLAQDMCMYYVKDLEDV